MEAAQQPGDRLQRTLRVDPGRKRCKGDIAGEVLDDFDVAIDPQRQRHLDVRARTQEPQQRMQRRRVGGQRPADVIARSHHLTGVRHSTPQHLDPHRHKLPTCPTALGPCRTPWVRTPCWDDTPWDLPADWDRPADGLSLQPRGRIVGTHFTAGWSSPVARRAHNPKVAGSNPAPATKEMPGQARSLDRACGVLGR